MQAAMSNHRGSRTLRRRPTIEKQKQQRHGCSATDRKFRSLQSMQERFCFALKRPRTSRTRPLKGGPSSSQAPSPPPPPPPTHGGKYTLMDNGLIQVPHCHYDYNYYYESPATLSFSSQEVTLSSSSPRSSDSSSITQVSGFVLCSPIPSLENGSDDGFSSDEVMSLVGCSDFVQENVLDFMPTAMEMEGHSCLQPPDAIGSKANSPSPCEDGRLSDKDDAGPAMEEGSSLSVEDDGEPYRIDLSDFEPDACMTSNCCATEQQQEEEEGKQEQRKRYGGQVLCLRLDYEEVLRAWKERGESFIAKGPSNYPSPYLDPMQAFSNATFVPHTPCYF